MKLSPLVYQPCVKSEKIWLMISCAPALTQKQLIVALAFADYVLADAWECLQDKHFQRLNRFSPQLCEQLKHPPQTTIDQVLSWLQLPDNHLITWDHPAFPQYLWQISSPPLLLYLKGNPEVLQCPQLAVVGSRKPTPIAQEITVQLCCDLAAVGYTITSGLAYGVDACAHQGALLGIARGAGMAVPGEGLLDLGFAGSTLAVLGSGIEHIYPACNRPLAEQIISQRGAIVSEFPLSAAPKRQHFPRRNRIVTGLALGTLVIEAALKSGSLISARHALEQNRNLMVVPTSPGNPQTAGGLQLLKDGAFPVACAQDVTNILEACSWPEWMHPSAAKNSISSERLLSQSLRDSQLIVGDDTFPVTSSKPDGLSVAIADGQNCRKELDCQSRHLLSCFDNNCISAEHLISRSNLTPSQFHVSLQFLQQHGYVCHKASGYQKLAGYSMLKPQHGGG